MPRRPKPFYDPKTNAWRLRFKTIVNGQEKRHHHLCSGANNETLAWDRALEIPGFTSADESKPRTIASAAAVWQKKNGDDWTRDILAPFIEWGSGKRLAQVHTQTLTDYLEYLKNATYQRRQNGKPTGPAKHYAPSTKRRQMRFARKVLAWAHARKFMLVPVPPMPKLPHIPDKPKDLEGELLDEVFGSLPSRAREVLLFMVLSGCRPEEATGLKYGEIKGDRIEMERGKTFRLTGQIRTVYLNDSAKEIIERQPTTRGHVFVSRLGKPYSTPGLRSIIRRVGDRVGVSLSGPYQLRHTFAQWAVDHDLISLDAVGEALGHRPGSSATKVYARIKHQRAAKEVQSLPSPVDTALRHQSKNPHHRCKRAKSSRKTAQPNQPKTAKGQSRQAE